MTRGLVASASAIERAGLASLLGADPAFEVEAVPADARTLARLVEDEHPDVVLVALDANDEAILQALVSQEPVPALVLLSDDPYGPWTIEALRSGVRAILPRSSE